MDSVRSEAGKRRDFVRFDQGAFTGTLGFAFYCGVHGIAAPPAGPGECAGGGFFQDFGSVDAMRITKTGDTRKGYEGEWSCPACGCHWEMDTTDAVPKFMSDQRDGNAWHMPCPTCKREVYRAVSSHFDQRDR